MYTPHKIILYFLLIFYSIFFTACKQDAGTIRCDLERITDYTGRGNTNETLIECHLRPERPCRLQKIRVTLNNGCEDISRLSVSVEGKKLHSIAVKNGKNTYNIRCWKQISKTTNLQLCADVRDNATEGHNISADINEIRINGKNIRPIQPLPGEREILLCRKCLYAPGDYGSVAWRIPALLQLSDGTILAVNDRRNDSEEDLPGCIDVVYRYSIDKGKTWSEPGYIARNKGFIHGYGDPGLAELPDGTVVCAFCGGEYYGRSKIENPQRSFVCFSRDHGRSWSQPKEITSTVWGIKNKNHQKGKFTSSFFSSGNYLVLKHGIHKGRLLIANVCRYEGDEKLSNHVVYTDDGGKNWKVSKVVVRKTGDEAKMLELPDGSILISIRTEGERQWAKSYDGGESWNEHGQWPEMHVTACNGDMITYNDNLILHSIPLSMQRENVSILWSYDHGKTWSGSKVILHGPSQYSSLTRLHDGTIAAYIEKNTHGVELWYENFSLKWLLRKKKVVAKHEKMKGIQLWENGPYWAEHNLGATMPEQAGDFYAWGEIQNKQTFGWDTYNYLSEDAAHAVLGGNWKIPSEADFNTLKNHCKWIWKEINGFGGYEIRGPKGSIFIPASGYISGKRYRNVRNIGQYWTSDTLTRKGAKEYYFNAQFIGECYFRGRDNGLPIRAISYTKP